jgi:NitT/TauT family transport system ATP-binding protein
MTNPDFTIAERGATPLVLGAAPHRSPFEQPLPHVRPGGISGMLQLLAEHPAQTEDIAHLSDRLSVTADDLLALLEAAALLELAEITDGDVTLTTTGRAFAASTIQRGKEIFRKQLLKCVGLFDAIVRTLEGKKDGTMRVDFFLDFWDEYFPAAEAQRQLETAVDWERFAELFDYDSLEGVLRLHELTADEAARARGGAS